jgi:pilus assembly protein CpaF
MGGRVMTSDVLSAPSPEAAALESVFHRAPLLAVEERVRQRSTDERLDLSTPGAKQRLRALIAEESASWHVLFQRGIVGFDIADVETLTTRAMRNLAGYGPLEELLVDDDVFEIMVNGPFAIFVKRHDGTSGFHHEVFHDDDHVLRTITKLLDDSASGSHRKLDPAEGLQDAQLDGGARLHLVHGDIARDGHLLLNIRKHRGLAIRNIDELVRRRMLDHAAADLVKAFVAARATMIVSGAPGSGKTTLLSCCLAELDPSLRVVTAEEVFEIDVPLPNVAAMQTRPLRNDRAEVDLRRLVAGFLRMAPDIAVVGEVRDREALAFLLTLSSGVKGYTTLHAGSARQALTRLRFVSQLADVGSEIPLSALQGLISESVDIVVQCERTSEGPRIMEIIAVEEHQGGAETTAFTTTELLRRPHATADLQWTGQVPVRLSRMFETRGLDVVALLRRCQRADEAPR